MKTDSGCAAEMRHELCGVSDSLIGLCGKDKNRVCTRPLTSKYISYFKFSEEVLLTTKQHAVAELCHEPGITQRPGDVQCQGSCCAQVPLGAQTGSIYSHPQPKEGISTRTCKGDETFLVCCLAIRTTRENTPSS